ncbi:MAG: MATE family efflux transporter [Bacteroidia bacterium]
MPQFLLSFWQKYRHHLRETTFLSIPVIVGQLGMTMMGVIDNLMIGKLGVIPLSAASLANADLIIFSVIGLGIAFAISPLVAAAKGAKDNVLVGGYFRHGMWVGLGTGVALGGIIWASIYVLPHMGQPVQDLALATSYLKILSLSVLPYMLFLTAKQFVDGLSLTVPAMLITLIGLATNVFGNWLLIYGNAGFPKLGLDGAGYATLFSRVLMMVMMLVYVLFRPQFRRYGVLKDWRLFDMSLVRKILSIGFPSGLQYFFEVGAFAGAVVMVGWLEDGSINRSAHQIVIQLAAITYMLVAGLSAGAAIRVGEAFGQRDIKSVRLAGMAGIYLAVILMIVASIILIMGRDFFPALFVSDTKVLKLASGLMVIAGLFQLFDGIQAVGIGILRGIQDVKIPTLLAFIIYWLVALPLGYIFGFTLGGGLEGIWYSLVVSLFLASVVLTWRFWRLTQNK